MSLLPRVSFEPLARPSRRVAGLLGPAGASSVSYGHAL